MIAKSDNQWIERAFAKYRLNKQWPWRAHIFAPAHHAASANRQLNAEWGDSGDDLSVPMSRTGEAPPEYFGASGLLSQKYYNGLARVVARHDGIVAFIVPNQHEDKVEVLAVLGSPPKTLVGQRVTFWDCARSLQLERIVPLDSLERLSREGELLLQSVVTLGERTDEGQMILAVSLPWFAILAEIDRDPEFLFYFSKHPRRFEEFIAGAYEYAGWPQVELTPQTKDKGRDVIATRPGFGSVRILDQAKAYSPGTLVSHNDVRAMLGVLTVDSNASKGIITTTSDFEPGILRTEEFSRFMPYRLEVKNGQQLREWLREIARSKL